MASDGPKHLRTGSPLPLESFAEGARELGHEAFEARYGGGFLILTATSFGSPADTYSTQVYLDGPDDLGSASTANMRMAVFQLLSDIHIVTVGRAPNNNVVIPDPSVSRVHALVKRSKDGVFLLLDVGSANGTSVNGSSVAVRGHGTPTALKTRDRVRFGQVEFTFVDARELCDFVLLEFS